MSKACVRHPMTFGDRLCSECGHRFCSDCIVFPYGENKPGLCIKCALERSGVRKRATDWPKLSRRAVRERLRVEAQQRAEAALEIDEDEQDPNELAVPWIGDNTKLDKIPGAWSETFG